MKCKFYILLFIGTLLVSIPVFGQKTVVVVQPDAGIDIGALNNAINTAADPGNTIFELKRDGLYLLNGAISHTGYTLHIRAEAGTGHRPILQPAADELGASSNHFNPAASLTLEGLHLQGRGELGAVANRPIVVSGTGSKIVLDDCYVDYTNQSVIRLTSLGVKIFLTNSTFRNSVRVEAPGNGRVVDTRGNSTDTIFVENSTIYNCGATIISGGGFSNYLHFNHNTVYQVSFTTGFYIDESLKAKVTNNIFYNYAYRANNSLHEPFFLVDSMFTVGTYSDADRFFDLSNNNFYTEPIISEILDEFGIDTLYRFNAWDTNKTDTIHFRWEVRNDLFANPAILDTAVRTLPPILLHFIANGQVDTTNIFSEPLMFQNAPPLNLDYWKGFVENNFVWGTVTPPSPFADEDPNVLGEVTTGAYNFSYNDNSRSATAAEGDLPLGALKWIPYTTVSAGDVNALKAYTVKTYPNPFIDVVTFEIESQESSSARIVIFDLTGKKVFSVNEKLTQGTNRVIMDMGKSFLQGIYFYKIWTDTPSGMKSVPGGKIVKK